MSRRERLIPAVAFALLVAMGALILFLVNEAATSGREALEESLVAEVQAVAEGQNSQATSLQTSLSGITSQEWELTTNSAADLEKLESSLSALTENLVLGYFLTDAEGTITQGVNLLDGSIGTPYDREGLGEGTPYLPVAPSGATTDLPNVAAVLPLFGDEPAVPEGMFVIEVPIGTDGILNQGFSTLARGETGEYMVYDPNGVVIASNDPAAVAEPVPAQIAAADDGLQHIDGDVVVVAAAEDAGWQIAFRQDRDEFEEGLSGPLQQVGTVTVVVFVVVGIVSFFALSRRLRAAREEQARLRQLSETQEEFISIVSHELRTPVAGVLGFLQTTIDHWEHMTEVERLGAVRRAASNARRLQGLTRDVLDSQSVESGRMTYAMNLADLREEVVVAVEAARALYPSQRFDTTLDSDAAPVRMDVDRIQQVLTNLIDNAVRMSPPDEPVELRLWTDGGNARVAIADRGPGVPADMEQRVFEKFVRGRAGTVTGTGLGLYIARQILEAHGGTISVDSSTGEGAEFILELPLSEEAAVPN